LRAKYLLLTAVLTILVLTPTIIIAVDNGTDQTPAAAGMDPNYVIVELKGAPISSYTGDIPGLARTMPVPGQKLDLNSPAAKAYGNYLAGVRQNSKNWLASNEPKVQVVAEYSVTLNAVALKMNKVQTSHLTYMPGAARFHADYLFSISMNRSTQLINAPVLWNAVGGQTNAGAGEKIGIIDTGIDNTHPFLTDPGLSMPAGFPKCDDRDASICGSITSNKVIVAKVFQLEQTNFDAHAAQDHGSHVSGIAAGVAGTSCGAGFDPSCTLSGIAPKAWLGSYNVFPGNVVSATSHTISKAVEEAVSDGMDVLNLSLGGTASPDDVLVNAVNSAVDAGLVVAIAAGNSGPAPGTVESPGIADKVITVGASTNPHFLGISVSTPGLGTFGAALGQFNNFVPPVTASYSMVSSASNVQGCNPIADNFSGMIALIKRGTCTFSTKIRNAQTAGATGVLVINNQLGDPTAMAQDGTPAQPTIPAAMVSLTNGNLMGTSGTVTVDGTTVKEFYSDGAGADILAQFSSRGPPLISNPGSGMSSTSDKIKPDVSAPGVNVYSSIRMASCASPPCYAFFSGTSMATPHVAGSAAVLKQLHPTWSPEEIKSALVNTAARPVKSAITGNPLSNPMDRGSGRINLAAAAMLTATVQTDQGQPSISFGTLPASSITRSMGVTLTSASTGSVTYTISINPVANAPVIPSLTSSATTVTVTSGGTGSFTVTLTLSPNISDGDYRGDIVVSGGTVTLNIPYWVRVNVPGLQPSGSPSSTKT